MSSRGVGVLEARAASGRERPAGFLVLRRLLRASMRRRGLAFGLRERVQAERVAVHAPRGGVLGRAREARGRDPGAPRGEGPRQRRRRERRRRRRRRKRRQRCEQAGGGGASRRRRRAAARAAASPRRASRADGPHRRVRDDLGRAVGEGADASVLFGRANGGSEPVVGAPVRLVRGAASSALEAGRGVEVAVIRRAASDRRGG